MMTMVMGDDDNNVDGNGTTGNAVDNDGNGTTGNDNDNNDDNDDGDDNDDAMAKATA